MSRVGLAAPPPPSVPPLQQAGHATLEPFRSLTCLGCYQGCYQAVLGVKISPCEGPSCKC